MGNLMTWIAETGRSPRRPALPARPVGQLLTCIFLIAPLSLPAQDVAPAPRRDNVSVYLEAIEKAETLDGPYSIELVDLYHGFGQALLEEGDLEGARDAFYRTAMVSRVNSGPNSLEQTNYLYSIARVESLLGNYGESVTVLENIYALNARQYGENDPEMLPVVEKLQAWYTEQKLLNGPQTRSSDFANRAYFARRIANLSEATSGLGNADTAERYRAEGQIHFRAIYYMLQSGEPPQPEMVINDESSGAQWYFERAISDHYREGEEAWERVVEAWRQNPDAGLLEVAEAMAQLGDWYLALQHFRAAEKQYEGAFNMLAASDVYSRYASEYLGSPSPLRFLVTNEDFVRDLEAPVAIEGLELSMTVTRNGRLLDVEVLSAPEGGTEEQLAEITERLENTRFRPAVINGKVESTEHFVWKPPAVAPKIAARAE